MTCLRSIFLTCFCVTASVVAAAPSLADDALPSTRPETFVALKPAYPELPVEKPGVSEHFLPVRPRSAFFPLNAARRMAGKPEMPHPHELPPTPVGKKIEHANMTQEQAQQLLSIFTHAD